MNDCLEPGALLQFSGGDKAVEREILASFRAANWSDTEALEISMAARDLDSTTRWAHRIKGAARMVGARKLAESAEALERALATGDPGTWQPALAAFRIHSSEIHRGIEAILSSG